MTTYRPVATRILRLRPRDRNSYWFDLQVGPVRLNNLRYRLPLDGQPGHVAVRYNRREFFEGRPSRRVELNGRFVQSLMLRLDTLIHSAQTDEPERCLFCTPSEGVKRPRAFNAIRTRCSVPPTAEAGRFSR